VFHCRSRDRSQLKTLKKKKNAIRHCRKRFKHAHDRRAGNTAPARKSARILLNRLFSRMTLFVYSSRRRLVRATLCLYSYVKYDVHAQQEQWETASLSKRFSPREKRARAPRGTRTARRALLSERPSFVRVGFSSRAKKRRRPAVRYVWCALDAPRAWPLERRTPENTKRPSHINKRVYVYVHTPTCHRNTPRRWRFYVFSSGNSFLSFSFHCLQFVRDIRMTFYNRLETYYVEL